MTGVKPSLAGSKHQKPERDPEAADGPRPRDSPCFALPRLEPAKCPPGPRRREVGLSGTPLGPASGLTGGERLGQARNPGAGPNCPLSALDKSKHFSFSSFPEDVPACLALYRSRPALHSAGDHPQNPALRAARLAPTSVGSRQGLPKEETRDCRPAALAAGGGNSFACPAMHTCGACS